MLLPDYHKNLPEDDNMIYSSGTMIITRFTTYQTDINSNE